MTNCYLCSSKAHTYLETTKPFEAIYYQCEICDLVFLDSKYYFNNVNERARYENHENHIRTQGYENFLLSCIKPIEDQLKPEMSGLDFGCGPYPMLKEILSDKGFELDYFDPIFFPKKALKEKYDFVTCTEVVEHFNNPRLSWEKMTKFLNKGSYLCIMTSFRNKNIDFDKWYYRVDPTHVCFYSERTLDWICSHFNLDQVYKSSNTAIFISKIDQ